MIAVALKSRRTKSRRTRSRWTAPVAVLGLALAQSACTTYGTGTSPAIQTVEDLAGIASLSSKKEPIDYKPRPKIVAPPSTAALPPPSDARVASTAPANWPVDQDARVAAFQADVAAREKAGQPLPKVRLPSAPRDESTGPVPIAAERDPSAEAMPKPGGNQQAKKLFADARASVAVDENGKPIRRYLSDPPPDYRMPDPTAPVEIIDKPSAKKKFKWPWQWFSSN